MTKEECLQKIEELNNKINSLPKGYISKKEIGGSFYYYHQWSENGIKKSRYLNDNELVNITKQLECKKTLQAELKAVKDELSKFTELKTFNKDIIHLLSCTLMHKNVPVIDLELDEDSGVIYRIGTIYSFEHLPIGVTTPKGTLNVMEFNRWWLDRSIPASRSGIKEVLEALNISNVKALLTRCYGLSLSDQYWISPNRSNLKWKDVNFFNNDFSEDIGDVLFGSNKKENAINFSSPDNTSDGNLKKRWKIIDDKRFLIKGGANPYRQQPLNEVIASRIMEKLNIPCISYSLLWNKGAPYCICEDFINENTELIPAWRIVKTQKQLNDASLYQHFVNCCNALGIPNVIQFLDQMIVLDYLILNEDRHLYNFGALRNAETLEWIGMAPIFDSGSSLGYDKTIGLMKDESEIMCKPFKKNHIEQLKLVTSFDWIDFDALSDIKNIIYEVLSDERMSDYFDEKRINTICELTEQRVKYLKKFANR